MGPILIVLLAARAFAQVAPGTEEAPTFRSDVALVKVDAQIVTRNGHNVTDLTQQDFVISDNGAPQKILYFARESEPLDLLLVLDVSGSMHRSLDQLAAAARNALGQLHAGDRAGVMLFSREARVREPLTADLSKVAAQMREAVREDSLGSGTSINSALISAALYLQKEPVRGLRAILIVTDNLSLNYQTPDEEVLRELFAADTVLNGMLIGKQKRPVPPRPGAYVNPDFTPSDIAKLAAESGGEAIEAARPGDALQQMIEHIRARYGMQYAAPASPPGTYHRIQVDLAPQARDRYRDAVVRARKGYFTK